MEHSGHGTHGQPWNTRTAGTLTAGTLTAGTLNKPTLSLGCYTYTPNNTKHAHTTPKVDQATRM
jgi:hypothetical protein